MVLIMAKGIVAKGVCFQFYFRGRCSTQEGFNQICQMAKIHQATKAKAYLVPKAESPTCDQPVHTNIRQEHRFASHFFNEVLMNPVQY